MTESSDLPSFYRAYIDCLNRRDWEALGTYVDADVQHNSRHLGLSGYREMLERDFSDIPDLQFVIEFLVADSQLIASRLRFECSPKGSFLGLPVNGRRIVFAENVIYEINNRTKIAQVWSVVDKAAIEAQLPTRVEPGSL